MPGQTIADNAMVNGRNADRPDASAPRTAAIDLAVIILNYNTRDLLRNCLRSLDAQGDSQPHSLRTAVYVVDNASSDGSADMVRAEFPAVRLIANRANVGYSAGNNVARPFEIDIFEQVDKTPGPEFVKLPFTIR